jgi:predicted SprT family Zn-dependent metalloprotease
MVELMRECTALTHEWVGRVNRHYDISIPPLKVIYSIKSTTAGRAYLGKNLIAYNPTLLRENADLFLDRTVGHEVIHFGAFLRYRDAGHGPAWHRMMREMGLDDSRCHSYNTRHVPSRVGKVPNALPKASVHPIGIVRPIGIGRIIELD